MDVLDIKIGDTVTPVKARHRKMRVMVILPGPKVVCRMPDGRDISFDPADLVKA